MTTKAQRILKLHAKGKSTREIAVIVFGVRPDAKYAEISSEMAYVRTVARQRKGRGQSTADIRYLQSPRGRKTRKRINREWYMNRHERRRRAEREAQASL